MADAGGNSLHGLRVVVTGGAGVLGRCVAEALHGQGACVVVLARRVGVALDLPDGVQLVAPAELTDADSARSAMARAVAVLQGLDGLVNVAGGFAWQSFEQTSIETWDQLYQTNLRTAVLASHAALPHLLQSGRGSVVNVGATGALKAATGMGAYAASKSGVMRLTEAMADEFKARGLRVNAVLPSLIDTADNRAAMPDADFSRWVRAEEIAAVIAFLLSPAASGVTGALIPVPGRV